MGKVVVLKIANGDFECGFHVSLAIGEDGVHPFTEPKGQLPPAPDILRHYTDWQSTYRKLVVPFGVRLEAVAEQVTNYSALRKQNLVAAQQLGNSINQWLNSWEFSPIREKLKQVLNIDENVRFIVQTDDIRLQCLPWHLWNLWEDYHQSEIAFSLSSYNRLSKKSSVNTKEQVRILAVFGESYPKNHLKINIEADWETLKSYFPDAEMLRLDRPKLEDLGNLIWKEQFDIIFYSGHSYSEREGTKNWLVINEQQNIEIRDLKHAFQRAVRHGLQLAIFNSCDGLGIGQQLASWCIPQVIVMREVVPDYVAQNFLQYFLESYAHKDEKPFYSAVREARERLFFLEDQCPGATWLPVIFQNPAEVPLTWQELCYIRATSHSQKTENNSNTTSSIPQVRSLTNINSPGENIVIPALNLSSRLVIILAGFYSFIKAFMQGVIKLMFRIRQKIKRLLGKLVQQNVEEFPNPELSQKQAIETPTLGKANEDNAGGLQVMEAVPKRPLPTLQEQIDSQPDNTTLTLWPPNYEYQGPIVIDRSVILDGQGATICGHKGPILSIQSHRVILRNLRIEVTGEQDSNNPQENCAILIKSRQSLEFHNVEVRGTVMGIPEEEGEWKYPNPLDLGQLAHGQEYELLLRIVVPVACKIASDVSGLQFEPRNLTPGPNEIRLHIEKLPKDTLINGSIFFLLSTSLKRRINLTAHIVSLQEDRLSSNQNSIIWQPENWSSFVSVQELQSQPSEAESSLVVSQNLTPILPSTESKIPPVYPQSQDEVQQGQTTPLRQPKIRRGEQLNNELFKLPDGSELSIDVQPDLNNPIKGDNPQIPQVFIQNEETFQSQTSSMESTSIPAKKYQVGSAFSLPNRDPVSKPDVDNKQDSPQLPISSLFLEQGSNSQQSLSNQDEVAESSTQVTPSSTPSSSHTRRVRSQPINPLFGQTLTPNQPPDKSNEEIKEESLESNNSSQLPKRKIVSSNEISSLFEDSTQKKQPNE